VVPVAVAVSVNALIFIDANQYLELYRTVWSKYVLAAIQEQRDYIFVTAQVVDEVNRNKLKVVAKFMADQLPKLELNSVAFPDHLLSATEEIRSLRNRLQDAKRIKEAFSKLTHDVLEQVSQSKDEVSKALNDVFSRAVGPKEDEWQRARTRKEHGNPPGKVNDALGDQLSWEQILTQCQRRPALWIITSDSDYATKHDGEMFLNAALYRDLTRLHSVPEVFCFTTIVEGLKDFADKTLVKAEKLPTPEEIQKIKKEQESLPPLDWDDSALIAIQTATAYGMRDAMLRRAALQSQMNSEQVILPPEPHHD
jgi:hypothetical protein